MNRQIDAGTEISCNNRRFQKGSTVYRNRFRQIHVSETAGVNCLYFRVLKGKRGLLYSAQAQGRADYQQDHNQNTGCPYAGQDQPQYGRCAAADGNGKIIHPSRGRIRGSCSGGSTGPATPAGEDPADAERKPRQESGRLPGRDGKKGDGQQGKKKKPQIVLCPAGQRIPEYSF